jgi:hypothetical protein
MVSTALNTCRAAAEVVGQLHQAAAAWRHFLLIAREALGLGVPEAEDRLIDVAHGVERSARAPAASVSPAARWCPEIRPSGCGRTARVRARACRDALEQAHGELFQVGEIEHAGGALALAIGAVEAAQDFEAASRAPRCSAP